MEARTRHDLQMMQAAPLSTKILMTKRRIRDWVNEYGEDGVYVSFSGGKDSTVLLTMAREEYPDIKAVFVDTGLEYPEIREFVKSWDNVEWIKPKMTFKEVVSKYGYPIISKEVSECVCGARKYLTSVIESETIDRPTDRPTDRTGIECGNYSARVGKKGASPLSTRGAETCRKRQVWKAVQYAEQGWRTQGGGGIRRFADLMGIRTTANTIDSRLYKDYRQFSGAEIDGNPPQKGEGDNGDYP